MTADPEAPTWREGDSVRVDPGFPWSQSAIVFRRKGPDGERGFSLIVEDQFVARIVRWMRTVPMADDIDVVFEEARGLAHLLAVAEDFKRGPNYDTT